jgi:hypothetical protein
MTGKEVISRKLSFSYPSLRAPVIQKAGAFECQQGGAAACLYFLVVGTSKKKNCGLLRFTRNDKFQIRHCELPLHERQEQLINGKGARQPAFILLSCVEAKRLTADCFASLAMTDYLVSSCNSLTPLPPSEEGVVSAKKRECCGSNYQQYRHQQ